MYRVELKAIGVSGVEVIMFMFLMYRVELKVVFASLSAIYGVVPNVPCGVERRVSTYLI